MPLSSLTISLFTHCLSHTHAHRQDARPRGNERRGERGGGDARSAAGRAAGCRTIRYFVKSQLAAQSAIQKTTTPTFDEILPYKTTRVGFVWGGYD